MTSGSKAMSDGAPLLRFTEQPYHAWEHGLILSQLQERGFAVLPDVFVADSVEPFRAQAWAEIDAAGLPADAADRLPDDSALRVLPARAPRLRQALQRTLAPTFPPFPIMLECTWLTRVAPAQGPDDGWHKDYDFEGFMVGRQQYPPAVAVTLFLEDVDDATGATEVVPHSHRDPSLSPYRGAARALLKPRRQDAVIWDQRLWHRATTRRAPGRRLHIIFGFYPSPILENHAKPMALAQERAWRDAATDEDRIYFGGIFRHPERRRG